jgi:hypothetical protein
MTIKAMAALALVCFLSYAASAQQYTTVAGGVAVTHAPDFYLSPTFGLRGDIDIMAHERVVLTGRFAYDFARKRDRKEGGTTGVTIGARVYLVGDAFASAALDALNHDDGRRSVSAAQLDVGGGYAFLDRSLILSAAAILPLSDRYRPVGVRGQAEYFQPLGDGLFGLKLSASIASWSFDSPVRRRTTSAGIGFYINFTAASGY